MTSGSTLSQKEIALFFFPLLLNVQLMSVSHAIINATLARQHHFITALAAFSVAMVLHLFIASPAYQNHTVTIALVRGRRSLRGVILFVLLVAAYVSTMLTLLAHTAFGLFVLKDLLGVNDAIAHGARSALAILAFLPFFTGFRGLFQGLVIKARRTSLVSLATGVRIAALLLFLLLGRRWFGGPALGAFALVACIVVETLLIGLFAWRCHLPPTGEEEKSPGEILRFALPLSFSSCLQQTVPLLINAIISRLPDGPLALASFGVVRGLLFLLAGPVRNLQQAYLTLVRNLPDYRMLVAFFLRLTAGLGLVMLLIAFPGNRLVLGDILGLKPALRDYIALPLAFCALYPFFYGITNLLRGFFTGEHRTGLLSRSTLLKVCYLLLCWGLLTLHPVAVPGIALAIFLLLSCELCEAGFLRLLRRRHLARSRLRPGDAAG